MKRLITSCLLLAGAGCVSPTSPIQIGPAFPIATGATTGACTLASTTESITGGSLDIAGTAVYLIAFGVTSDLQPTFTTVVNGNNQQLQGPDDNDFLGTQVRYTYTSNPNIGLTAETQPLHVVVPPGALGNSGQSFIIMDAFGPNAAQKLAAAGGANIVSSIQLQGALRSGQSMQSDVAAFPITVFQSNFSCSGARAPTGPCGFPGGQDGTQPICCVVPDGGTKPNGCP